MSAPLPALPTTPLERPLRVVVLTCGDDAWETARALASSSRTAVVGLVKSARPRPRGAVKRLRAVYRYHGVPGLMRVPLNKAQALVGKRRARSRAEMPPVPLLEFDNFHDADCLAALAALAPDLGVVDGTYILRESVFGLPRFGSVNLHCGKLPDYRGAPPAFWELYDGETEVGVTIHRVTDRLDEGPILAQELFPLEFAPAGDPWAYVNRYWLDVLRPNGIRMLVETAEQIASGTAVGRPQGPSVRPTYRRPDYRTVQAFRNAIRARRRGKTAGIS